MMLERLAKRLRVATFLGLAAGIAFLALGDATEAPNASPGEAAAKRRAAGESAARVKLPEPELKPLEPTALAPRSLAAEVVRSLHSGVSQPPVRTQWAIPAGLLDPSAALVEGPKLVQVLDDGTRLELTLDPMLQSVAERALARYKVEYGVVVAIRPQTGEILAMAEHAELRPDLRHLALQAEGPAASIFKIVTTSALIESGKLDTDSPICTHGGLRGITFYHLQDRPKRDKYCTTLGGALGASNNVAFARWADRLLTPETLEKMAERFLFNRRLPFLWGVGASEAKMPRSSRVGFAQAAAGFKGTTLSPLHAALIAATIANDGTMMTPRLVARATRGGEVLYRADYEPLARVLDPEVARAVGDAMINTTTRGTAEKFFKKDGKPRMPGMRIAAKTGSLAAVVAGPARNYSWFVAFAPAGDPDKEPELAVAALVINGTVWTTKGVVPARELLDAWYAIRKTGGGRPSGAGPEGAEK